MVPKICNKQTKTRVYRPIFLASKAPRKTFAPLCAICLRKCFDTQGFRVAGFSLGGGGRIAVCLGESVLKHARKM